MAAQQWDIGEEREVDEGYYLKLLSNDNGWRLWQLDTEKELSCRAIKSARGRSHPKPVGVAAAFYGGTPFLTVFAGLNGKTYFSWQGEHLRGERVKYRELGSRFWMDWSYDTDLSLWDGKPLEINIVTYEYPTIFEGRAEETAVIDLSGLADMTDAVHQCGPKAK